MNFKSKEILEYIDKLLKTCSINEKQNITSLNRKQKRFIRKFCTNNYVIVAHSRLVGVSTILELLIITLCKNFPDINIAYVSNNDSIIKDCFSRVMRILNHLEDNDDPAYYFFNRIEFRNGSKIQLFHPNSNISGIDTTQFSVVIVDNAAYIVDSIMDKFRRFFTDKKIYKKQNIPCGIVIASTPHYNSGFFYDCWNDEKNKFFKFKWSWKGTHSREWFRKTCLALNNDQKKIKNELNLEFTDS